MRSSTRKNPEHSAALERELKDLKSGAAALSLHLSKKHIDAFRTFVLLLNDFQGRIHLISHQDHARIAKRHLLPSLMVRSYVQGIRVCDIGSGAGLPGVPLAILDTDVHVTLFESVGKRAGFLAQVKDALGLENIEIIHERAEEYEGDRFDTILLRAVGRIKKNVKTVDRLLDTHARAIFFKTHKTEQELIQARSLMNRLGFSAEVHKLYTPIEQRPLAFVLLQRMMHRS